MGVATLPQVAYEFAFNADAGQNALPPYWQDLSARVLWAWETVRGRQYELDTNETGEWHPRLDNRDGALDPGNAASPFAPNVLLYRRGRIRVVLGNNLLLPDQACGGEWSGFTGPPPPAAGVSSTSGYQVSAVSVGASAYQGTQVFAATVPSGVGGTKNILTLKVAQVTAGGSYTFTAQVQATTTGQSPVVLVAIAWLNAAGATVATTSSSTTTLTGGAGAWTQMTVSGTAPAGAVAAVLQFNTTTTLGANTTFWCDGLQWEARGFATRWQMPWTTGANLFPQIIAVPETSPLTAAKAWAPDAGTVAYAANLTAAPTGQTSAIAWTTPSGTTSAPNLWTGPELGNPSTSLAHPSADNVQVTPGLSYTASFYGLRAASADATLALTVGFAWYTSTGAWISQSQLAQSALSTSAWGRMALTATAPAGAAWCRTLLWISTPSTTTATNTVYLTGGQFEQAASASTWADPGPAAYVFNGYIERLPQDFTEMGRTVGTSEPILQDAFGTLATGGLQAPFVNEALALKPNFLFQLSDATGSTSAVDSAGKRGTAPVENGPAGAGSLTFGSAITATSPTTGAFAGAAGPVATFANTPTQGAAGGSQPETYISVHKATVAVAGPPAGGGWTRIAHFRSSRTVGISDTYTIWYAGAPTNGPGSGQFWMRLTDSTVSGQVDMAVVGTAGTSEYVGNVGLADGNWHQLAIAVTTGGAVTMYVDGAQVTPNIGGSSITLPMSGIATDVIGATVVAGAIAADRGMNGDVALALELPFAATAAQISNLYTSWRSASAGESSGARYARVLTWAGYAGASAIDSGQTQTMGPATDLIGQTPLDALNAIALTENGDHYASAAGVLTFKARSARYNQRTPAFVFGEGAPVGSLGEWPCEVSRIEYDPSHLANSVQVTQWGGSTYPARDATSATRYLPRTYLRTINSSSGPECQAAASYLLAQLKDPHLRPEQIVLHPSAVPGLMPVCVALEKGLRIRLIKRPVGGTPIIVDCFVERIEWQWDPETADVWVTVQASPADLTNYGVLAALHTTLNVQAAAGQNKATINALPDAAYNLLSQSLPSGYSLTFEPGTSRAETLTLAAGGIPTTALNYTSAQLTFTSNLAFTHAAGTVVCEPLPAGISDPTTWDASAVIGATSTTVVSGGASGTATVTVAALPDAAYNALGSTWNTNDQVTLSPGTANAETMTILSVAATSPGYTSGQITFTANLAHSHAVGDTVCDPLPAGVNTPAGLSPTLRLAY